MRGVCPGLLARSVPIVLALACGSEPEERVRFVPADRSELLAPDTIGNSACVAAIQGGDVKLERFDISEARCGFGTGWGGTLSASHGRVHHNEIGLNVRDDVFDFDAVLTSTVRFFENGTNVDSAELQLPDAPM
jgi:hypothetical protein